VAGLADLDAVTLDANGTLVGLVDPVPELERELRARGVSRPAEAIRRAFEAEGAIYATRAVEAHEPSAFSALQHECTGVFLAELETAELDPGDFVTSYVSAMRFEVLPGVRESLRRLRLSGLELAVVANFDLTLARRLEELELSSFFSIVVTPADAGVAKPEPEIFELALERLRVRGERTLHIGDGASDEEGARRARMRFEWAPLPAALERWA
jgi:putative hydrolase of the HAD superfamily